MFFFKKKDADDATAVSAITKSLADIFSVELATASAWVSCSNYSMTVTLPFVMKSQLSWLNDTLIDSLAAINTSYQRYTIKISHEVCPGKTKVNPLENVKNIIAVASGKGGVGKSATSVNLAAALALEGAKVGIVDADIYGPSIPMMLGQTNTQPSSADNKNMQPIVAHGLVSNSIGYLVSEDDATIWRGPMASRALTQIVNDTNWPELDYLIVDMPPGTGDIQLTVSQQLPITAAVVVTTPQDLALADAKKGIAMFNKVGVPIVGLIENMSYFQCSKCGHQEYIFSQNGGQLLSERYGLPILGAIPLSSEIRQSADNGVPLPMANPDSQLSSLYREIARDVSMSVALTIPQKSELQDPRKGESIPIKSLE